MYTGIPTAGQFTLKKVVSLLKFHNLYGDHNNLNMNRKKKKTEKNYFVQSQSYTNNDFNKRQVYDFFIFLFHSIESSV